MIRISTAVRRLEKAFPKISGITDAREWNPGLTDAIFLGDVAEGGNIDGLPAADYYNEDYKETVYVLGVHKKLREALDKLGFFPECHDPGTWVAYRK